jgi:hypothetical protein
MLCRALRLMLALHLCLLLCWLAVQLQSLSQANTGEPHTAAAAGQTQAAYW